MTNHCHPLVQQMFEIAKEKKATQASISDRVGIDRATMRKWRFKYTPRLALLEAALNVLGYELCIRKREVS